jgi:hypothetical protein
MTLSMENIDGENIVKDDKGRVIVRAKGGQVAIARFPDMDETTKEYVAKVYADLTGRDADKAMQFLNYETDTNEFCS